MRNPAELLATMTDALRAVGVSEPSVHHTARKAATDYAMLQPWLPVPCTDILDIGCGLGGIDVWLAEHYPDAHLHLIDGKRQLPKQMGWNQQCEAWNDVHVALQVVAACVPQCFTMAGWYADVALTICADFIFSLTSCGHHYPVSVYLPLIDRSLKPNGRVVLDIRKGTQGKEEMEQAGFETLAMVYEGRKFFRHVFVRKGDA